MVKLSNAQARIVDRIRAGAVVSFDTGPGRYVIRENGNVRTLDHRPIEVMLRHGALEKDALGRCSVVETK